MVKIAMKHFNVLAQEYNEYLSILKRQIERITERSQQTRISFSFSTSPISICTALQSFPCI